jgi:hypothetical protein
LSQPRWMSERDILPELSGRQPSKIKPECGCEEFFWGDALSERPRDRIRMKAPSLACPEPFGLELTAERLRRRAPPMRGAPTRLRQKPRPTLGTERRMLPAHIMS